MIKSMQDKFIEFFERLKRAHEELTINHDSDVIDDKDFQRYNQKILPIIWDTIPLDINWDDNLNEQLESKTELVENKNYGSDYGDAVAMAIGCSLVFKTPETKTEFLFGLANSLMEYSKHRKKRDFVEMIYQICFGIIYPNAETGMRKNLEKTEKELKDGVPPDSIMPENSNFMLDELPLEVQIRYHRWAITNKKKVLHTSHMRNRFIFIVADKHFKNYLSNNLAESHAKLNTVFLHHMDLPTDLALADTLRKWIGIFTKSVMLVYYGYYKWDKYRGDFYNKEGEKLPQGDRPNSEAFYKYLDISVEEIRDWGNKYRKETPKRNYGSRGRADKRTDM